MAKNSKKSSEREQVLMSVIYRGPFAARFNRVHALSRRTRASLIAECLERMVPEFEKRYANLEIAA